MAMLRLYSEPGEGAQPKGAQKSKEDGKIKIWGKIKAN